MKTKALVLFILPFLSTNAIGQSDILFGGGLVGAAIRHHKKNADTDAVLAKYKDKFVVVMDDGLSVGSRPAGEDRNCFGIVIDSRRRLVPEGRPVGDLPGETPCAVDPLRKGEVLKVLHAGLYRGYLSLNLQNLSPHSIIRGLGAFAHQSVEIGKVSVAIRAGDKGKDLDAADALAAHWFKSITSPDAAPPELGNTASGVFIDQVKAGMSFAEVEHALGVPQTRFDLGEKVLYKYRDMTIEFHGGKVTDVR